MKRSAEQKLERALGELADGLAEIREMGILKLRFGYKEILAKVEKHMRAAAQAIHEDEAP